MSGPDRPTGDAPSTQPSGASRVSVTEPAPATEPGGRLAKVLDYVGFVTRTRALGVVLDDAPRKLAACVDADVASLYLLEGDGRALVMRGNVGFPRRARGQVRLTVGEGITGKAVELGQPIAAAHAPSHPYYREFPELHEERYPVLLAMPILGPTGPLGAVVVQRAEGRPFDDDEVSLLAALATPISSAIRLARLLDDLREKPSRTAGGGTRKVTLPGVPIVPGRALGAVAALRRPSTSPQTPGGADDADRFEQAIEEARRGLRALGDLASRLEDKGAFLQSYLVMLDDQRLRQRTLEQVQSGTSLAAALGLVAREAVRVATESADDFRIERARDLAELCDALLMLASPDSRAALPSRAVVVADQLSIYDLLVTVRAQPVGFALAEPSPRERSRALLDLMGVPAIADVQGAFRWVAPGDIALVDADHGFLVLNPTRSDIATFRADKKRERERGSRPPGP
jgi:phosphotransferase system, enzyme I, PtsP